MDQEEKDHYKKFLIEAPQFADTSETLICATQLGSLAGPLTPKQSHTFATKNGAKAQNSSYEAPRLMHESPALGQVRKIKKFAFGGYHGSSVTTTSNENETSKTSTTNNNDSASSDSVIYRAIQDNSIDVIPEEGTQAVNLINNSSSDDNPNHIVTEIQQPIKDRQSKKERKENKKLKKEKKERKEKRKMKQNSMESSLEMAVQFPTAQRPDHPQ